MDSSIARQKIGKRRPSVEGRDTSTAFRYRPTEGSKPYSAKLQDRRRETQHSGPPARRARRGGHAPGLGARLALFVSRICARLRMRLGESLAFSLRRRLRSLAHKPSSLPKARLAIIAASALAAIVALSTGIAAIARGPAFPLPSSGLLPVEKSAQNLLLDYVSPELADGRADADQETAGLPPAPVTLEVSTYRVRSGDSLASVAKHYGLYMDTIISANGISSASAIKPGTQLRIPNINGLIYKVRPADNLASISKRYKIDTTRIVDANDLGSSRLISGQSLFIPGARLPDSEVNKALGQKVAWPARGPLSSFFGYRDDPFTGVRRFHAGIDIVVNSGTPVRAAMDGKVSDTGYNANYGNYVILNHTDGFQTLYGHLTSASVAVGTKVAQGSMIGISGNTGYSTGPHLHFGIYRRSLPLNPLKYLKHDPTQR
ncbi:MAG: M23 family metallopeptidase [Rectinemataceae bacterium]